MPIENIIAHHETLIEAYRSHENLKEKIDELNLKLEIYLRHCIKENDYSEEDIELYRESDEYRQWKNSNLEIFEALLDLIGAISEKCGHHYNYILGPKPEVEDEFYEVASIIEDSVFENLIKEFEKIPEIDTRSEYVGAKVETLDEHEVEKLVDRISIRSDRDYKGRYLTVEILQKNDLLPKYKVTIGDSVVWYVSDIYKALSERDAVVAYVEDGEELAARTYYQSNSHGVWKYLPAYELNDEGEIGWYDKGYGESSITLPTESQFALGYIDGQRVAKNVSDNDLVFAGTARRTGDNNTYRNEVESSPLALNKNFFSYYEVPVEPERLILSADQYPNFDKKLKTWVQNTAIYGQITVDIFESNDGELRYMFCRDERGRAWIGSVEDKSEFGSTGLRKKWIKAGDLTIPAYEYDTQVGHWGNWSDRKVYGYVDMFKNYLSKVPVIQDYVSRVEK